MGQNLNLIMALFCDTCSVRVQGRPVVACSSLTPRERAARKRAGKRAVVRGPAQASGGAGFAASVRRLAYWRSTCAVRRWCAARVRNEPEVFLGERVANAPKIQGRESLARSPSLAPPTAPGAPEPLRSRFGLARPEYRRDRRLCLASFAAGRDRSPSTPASLLPALCPRAAAAKSPLKSKPDRAPHAGFFFNDAAT